MTVHFIGAGPGAPDLITVRGRDLIARSPVCLYAGSLVPTALLTHCPPDAEIVDTAPMTLDEIVARLERATNDGKDVARLHSGDLSVWSALGEQLRRLDQIENSLHDNSGRSGVRGGVSGTGARIDAARSRAVRCPDAHVGASVFDAGK